jgi:tRNA A37 threonylcarbamoyladenosine synthetase subunit TsaC/SUA5/YrdC
LDKKIVNQVDYFVKTDKDSILKPSTIIEIKDDSNFEIIR